MKKTFLLLALLFVLTDCICQINRKPDQQNTGVKKTEQSSGGGAVNYQFVVKEKNPGAAYVLSLVLPGAGQMYNGEIGKGFGVLITQIIGSMLITTGTSFLEEDLFDEFAVDEALIITGSTLISAAWLYSIIDAPIAAKKINKKIRNGEYGTSLRFKMSPVGAGLCLSF